MIQLERRHTRLIVVVKLNFLVVHLFPDLHVIISRIWSLKLEIFLSQDFNGLIVYILLFFEVFYLRII